MLIRKYDRGGISTEEVVLGALELQHPSQKVRCFWSGYPTLSRTESSMYDRTLVRRKHAIFRKIRPAAGLTQKIRPHIMAAASSATSSTTSASIAFDIIIDLGLGRGGLLAAVDAENAASGGITHLDDDSWGV
jgi:hypothetical protein